MKASTSDSNILHFHPEIGFDIQVDTFGVKRELPKDVLEELKKELRKEGTETISTNIYTPTKLPSSYPKPSAIFTGRVDELNKFKELLNKVNFISIEGLGGFGKTEFSAKCIENFISKDKVIWFDCNPDSKLDTLISLSGYEDVLKGESKTELAKYSGFTDLIERDEKTLFLDNFHDVSDSSFKEFFKFAERRLNKVKIIIISREHSDVGIRIASVNIGGLKEDASLYARRLRDTYYSDVRVDDSGLKGICESVVGHPLAIELALQLIRYGESPEEIVKKIVQAEDKSSDLSHRLLDEIFNHPKSTEHERKVMLHFSVFRGEVDKKAIYYILGEEDSNITLRRLIDKKMIAISNNLLSTHPLVREFCYKKFENKKEAHLKASEYLKTLRIEKFYPPLEEEIAHHLFCGEYLERAADLISEKSEEFILSCHTNYLKEIIDKSISKGILRPKFYVFYGDIAEIRGEWNDASAYYEKAFSDTSVNEKILAEAYIKYGEILYKKGDIKESLEYFEDAYEMCKKNGFKKEEARSLNDIGLVYQVFGNLSIAESKINEALSISKAIGDKRDISTYLSNIGIIYDGKDDFDKALAKYKESLIIREEIGDKQGIATCINNIGGVFNAKGNLKMALDKYNESLTIYKEIGDKQGIATCINNIGGVFNANGNLKMALDKYNESLTIYKEIGDKHGIATCIHNFGTIFFKDKKYDMSLRNLFESISLTEQMGISRDHKTTNYIFKNRKVLGLCEFKKLAQQILESLPENLKSFVKLEEFSKDETIHHEALKVGRNDPCPCGSGKKYKKCCGN
ncbi:MAG: tetratricopeptide repeat protein [Nitrospinae bacterium]|nr:tetratricopeptide repeat protein [Nitrospinota bacterium]